MVSFVIPNWNRADLLGAALQSIRSQTWPAGEVIVVDNGSLDGSQQTAQRAGARVLQLGRNRGFSFAVNRGLEAARGELVAVVNNDLEFLPDWTEKLVQALERKGVWFATGKLLDYTRRDHIDGVGDAICRGGTACRLGHGRVDSPLFNEPRKTFFPSATAVLMRREFWRRAGGLEEAFFAYLEDVDLGLRAALLGLEGVYAPEAVAYHWGSATLGPWSGKAVEWRTRNQILLVAKFYPASLLGKWWRPLLAAQALWALQTVRHGCPLAYARGLCAGLIRVAGLRRAGAAWRTQTLQQEANLASVLMASEAELTRFQKALGWDPYWRWYFRLAPLAEEIQQ